MPAVSWAERAAVAVPSLVLGQNCPQGISVGVAIVLLLCWSSGLGELEQRHLLQLETVASVC